MCRGHNFSNLFWWMADVFLNSANFAQHTILTLNLKALVKVSKVSWTSQLSYKVLYLHFKENSENKNLIFPKSLGLLGLRIALVYIAHHRTRIQWLWFCIILHNLVLTSTPSTPIQNSPSCITKCKCLFLLPSQGPS